MRNKAKLPFQLFLATFTLSAFTLGGGYVIVPMMKKKFVDHYQWIEEEEMLNMVAIAQSSPGAIAVNTSILVGYKMMGFIGAGVSVLGTILPPLLILSWISLFYESFQENPWVRKSLKAMGVAVVAIIADVVWKMIRGLVKEKCQFSQILLVFSFVGLFFLKIDFKWLILFGGVFGLFYQSIFKRKEVA